jgi:hypothetical protein
MRLAAQAPLAFACQGYQISEKKGVKPWVVIDL